MAGLYQLDSASVKCLSNDGPAERQSGCRLASAPLVSRHAPSAAGADRRALATNRGSRGDDSRLGASLRPRRAGAERGRVSPLLAQPTKSAFEAMRALIAEGVAAAEAATLGEIGGRRGGALRALSRCRGGTPSRRAGGLRRGGGERRALDRALSAFSLDVFTGAVVLPAIAAIGSRWAAGEVSVAQEHFATSRRKRAPARPLARLGIRAGPARAAGLPARRAARHRPDRVRALAAKQGLADRLSGPGHSARHARRDRPHGPPRRGRGQRRRLRVSRVSR